LSFSRSRAAPSASASLQRLIKRKDVDKIINACDAGREGELIFRYIIDATGTKKPIQRMWMQSMTNNAILEAFQKLRTDEQMRPLADAAKCRSESDWIVGINGTRALTALNSKHGGFRLTPVGRSADTDARPSSARSARMPSPPSSLAPTLKCTRLFGIESGRYNGRWLNGAASERRARRAQEEPSVSGIRSRPKPSSLAAWASPA